MAEAGNLGDRVAADEAHRRAVQNYSEFSQHTRMAAQLAIAANGGAAIALVAFLSDVSASEVAPRVVSIDALFWWSKLAASFYMSGILLCAIAIFLLSMGKLNWGHAWEEAAFAGHLDFESCYARRGSRFNLSGFWFLILSIAVFAPGTAAAVWGFVQLPPGQ